MVEVAKTAKDSREVVAAGEAAPTTAHRVPLRMREEGKNRIMEKEEIRREKVHIWIVGSILNSEGD